MTTPVSKVVAVIEVRVRSVTEAPQMRLSLTEELGTNDNKTLVGGATFMCDLKYRPTAKVYNIPNSVGV